MYEATSLDKLIKFLEILNVLANTEDFKILNAGNFYIQTQVEDNERINLIFNHVENKFKRANYFRRSGKSRQYDGTFFLQIF